MPKTNLKDNVKESLNITLLGVFGGTATGRYPITCLVIIAALFMGGLAYGFW
ncbi:hypothetical protein [Sinorhizobium fredii]|uniref:hypothetical protein n=1 Tax=Rhizobium fredii TaxID=380 RepID=UPI0035186BEF